MLKDDVFLALEESRERPISGQELADRFGVSRNAVWKAVNQLKKEGHIITSDQVLGYALDSEPALRIADLLSACAAEALAMIRHEHIEPASPRAYYVFARTVQVLYRIGASIELFLLGYKLERL